MRNVPALVALAGLVLTMAHPVPVWGQAKKAEKGSRKPEPKKLLRVEAMKVEGRIQKPQAMFLMPRANLNTRELEAAEPFLPKAVEALEREPF